MKRFTSFLKGSFYSWAQSADGSLFESLVHFYYVWKSTLVIMWESFKFHMICSRFLSSERWKVLFRYSYVAHKCERVFENPQGWRNVWVESRGLWVSSHFMEGRKRHSKIQTSLHPALLFQTILLLSNEGWDVALLHLWMTLSVRVSYTLLGRLGMKSSKNIEWQFNQRPFSCCPVSMSIKLLHFTWPAR